HGGGTDDRSVRIAHALARQGLKIWLAGPSGREFSLIARDLGLSFHETPIGPLRLPLILDIAKFIRRERVQIIHARHGRDYWPAIFAAKLSRTRPKIVLSRHLAKSPGSWLSRRFLLSQCDALVAVSHFVAKVLRDGHADPQSDNPERHLRLPMRGDFSKIHVAYGGFDMTRFSPADAAPQRAAWGLHAGDFAFGVVGGYSFPRGKGQPEFLRAAALVRDEIPEARFLIIGRGNMRAALEKQIHDHGLQRVAWLTPYCPDMAAGFNALDCLVLPQVGTEAIPGVICEAHACGRPAIATDLDGIPEAFAPGGYGELIRPGSIKDLAAAMKRWARTQKPDLHSRWHIHEKVASVFSLEKAARELAGLYELLLGSASGKN
ncbi:MAG TPA: glycosyltransferase, partial [Verrucomicrobiae bacterium]|nr:glycosyltransferase [Verrucomicrobiae bacterium]